jgi:hypothetical protein
MLLANLLLANSVISAVPACCSVFVAVCLGMVLLLHRAAFADVIAQE